MLNETHNPDLRSWLSSANDGVTDFPIQNLPIASFKPEQSETFRGGIAIGDQIIDLQKLLATGLVSGDAQLALVNASHARLNSFMAMGDQYWSALRLALSRLLRAAAEEESSLRDCLEPQAKATFGLPCSIGDYTDFYTSIHHASRIGKLFRPDNPLLPNYKWVPIGYHGRASSIGISGESFFRPNGQTKGTDEAPIMGPCERLDYELELGIFMGPGNEPGQPIKMQDAEHHIFGVCLLNDWSARDIQAWEYQPLGPFLAKSFATTLSPWIISREALAPFRGSFSHPAEDPQPLAYLDSSFNQQYGSIDISLSCFLLTSDMREQGLSAEKLSESNSKHAYWTMAQLVTHHAVNGCNLSPGDLFGSGTQSGIEASQGGCLLELTNGGKSPISLSNGESRTFLRDGDTIIMRGACHKAGAASIGFGEVSGSVKPALAI